MDIKFKTLDELYERLTPALNAKVHEFSLINYAYLKKEDIWNYIKDTKWIKAQNLTLADMVDDILNCNELEVDNYIKNNLKKETRSVSFSNLDNLL